MKRGSKKTAQRALSRWEGKNHTTYKTSDTTYAYDIAKIMPSKPRSD